MKQLVHSKTLKCALDSSDLGELLGNILGTKEVKQTYACSSKSKSGAAPPHNAQQKVAQHWVGTQGS